MSLGFLVSEGQFWFLQGLLKSDFDERTDTQPHTNPSDAPEEMPPSKK